MTSPTLNGDLSDWLDTERLDKVGVNNVSGTKVYGRFSDNTFFLALQTAVPMGANTTLWLNTDAKPTTGFQVFGGVGAEFNVNFDANGIPHLYTGDAGQTFVSDLSYAFSPDHMTLELALPRTLIGAATTSVEMVADVNNTQFLPTSYSLPDYRVAIPAFDGVLTEWTSSDRVETPATAVAGYELYGKVSGGNYIFAIKSALTIGQNTTFWLNTDGNTATGAQPFGTGVGATPVGAEFNVNVGADGIARLYTGLAGQTLVATLDSTIGPDGHTMEFAVPTALLGANVTKVAFVADVNDAQNLPLFYNYPQFTIADPAGLVPQPAAQHRIAIVYSETTAAKYFSTMAYAQLIMNAQSQAMAAGVPFDVVTEADLTNLTKMANYDTIVFPSFREVPDNYAAIASTLTTLVYDYNKHIIAAGDFMTNDKTGAALPGDSYANMETILGVHRTGPLAGVTSVEVVAGSTPITTGYAAGSDIHVYSGAGTSTSYYDAINPAFGDLHAAATQVVVDASGTSTHNAVLTTVTGSTNVHFATEGMMADSNLLGKAIEYVESSAGVPGVSLHMSRNTEMVAARVDMDQAQETEDVDGTSPGATLGHGIYDALVPILAQWKAQYNFVGSYYIDIGATPTLQQSTDWVISKPYYDAILALGNEIGSHSITHPEDTNYLLPDLQAAAVNVATKDLSVADYFASYSGLTAATFTADNPGTAGLTVAQFNSTLQAGLLLADPTAATVDPTTKAVLAATYYFEFELAKTIIQSHMSTAGSPFTVDGAAVPGMPESVATAEQILQYYSYISGGGSLVGAGYPGAIGYLQPADMASNKIYIAPNMAFDFTLTGFQKLSAAAATTEWLNELSSLTKNSDLPIVVWPWHDYGPTQWVLDAGVPSPNSIAMFTSVIQQAYNSGAEFVTLDDLANRIRAFEGTTFNYSASGDVITASANLVTGGLGTFALDLDNLGTKTIASVTNWYAYDNNSVFLDNDGGTFQINLGATQADITHITSIGARAKLMALTGDGTNVDFTIAGDGKVVIDLKAASASGYTLTGATLVSQVGAVMTVDLGASGSHAVSIHAINSAPTDITVSNQIVLPENTSLRTKIADLLVVDPDTDPALRHNVVTVSDARFEIDAVTGALYLKAGQAIDFEAANTINLNLIAADGLLSVTKPLTIVVGDVNEAATDIVLSNQAMLGAGSSFRTKVADLTVVDPDLQDAFRHNLVSVNDARFEIDATDGGLYIKSGQVINTLAGNTLGLTLTAADGALSFSKNISLAVHTTDHVPLGTEAISGNLARNNTVTAVDSFTDADGIGTVSHLWQRTWDGGAHWTNVGSNSSSYTIGDADVGGQLRVVSFYTDNGGVAEAVGSAASHIVADDRPDDPLVNDAYYYAQNPDVLAAGMDADFHYHNFGWKEGRNPDALFNTKVYLGANPDVAKAGMDPLAHFEQFGWKEGRDPSAGFDDQVYLAQNPDVAAAHMNPLVHYLQFGMAEGRPIHAAIGPTITHGFDAEYYLLSNPDVAAAAVDPLWHFNNYGWKEGRNPNAEFDTKGYLAAYGDVAASGMNPLDHYMNFGAAEGRDPSMDFDTSSYLAANPDVLASHMNPLEHYLEFGIFEGRSSFADGSFS